MKIGIAQTRAFKGDITGNLEKHLRFISLAASLKATSLFFPELSLTGYEPELAEALATNQDDRRLDVIQQSSNNNKITIGLGLPTKENTGNHISMIIFRPDNTRLTYSKQQLHPDEFPFFINGDKQLILNLENKNIAPAICYESLQPSHSDNAHKLGADIYLASVAKPQKGLDKALIHYPAVARKFSMPVLMSNSVGYCDNFESVGFSTIWNKEGVLVEQLDGQNEGILIFDTDTEEVIKKII